MFYSFETEPRAYWVAPIFTCMSRNTLPPPRPFEKCPSMWMRDDCWVCSQWWALRGAFFWSFSPGPFSVAAVGPDAKSLNPWSSWGQVPGVLGDCSLSSVLLSQMLKVAHVHIWTCVYTHMHTNTHLGEGGHISPFWMIIIGWPIVGPCLFLFFDPVMPLLGLHLREMDKNLKLKFK